MKRSYGKLEAVNTESPLAKEAPVVARPPSPEQLSAADAARKARMAVLASKIHAIEEDEPPAVVKHVEVKCTPPRKSVSVRSHR